MLFVGILAICPCRWDSIETVLGSAGYNTDSQLSSNDLLLVCKEEGEKDGDSAA